MLVLLPPSESKAEPPRRGRALDLAALSFPELTAARALVLEALVATSARDDAADLLGIGPSLAPDVARNTRLRDLPCVPVHTLYTGVLYDALGWPTLDAAARRRASSRVVIASALWGALRPGDRVPPYRLSMAGDLVTPGHPTRLGPLARLWRPALEPVLTSAAGRRGVVVDCRSSTYAAAWPVAGALAGRTVAVRVLREADGVRSVVSHLAKHTRGEVTRVLLEQASDPRTPAELAECLSARWCTELTPPPRSGRSWTLDVVLGAKG